MAKKIRLKVVYGIEACEYAEGHNIERTIRKIKDGSINGDHKTYLVDTEEDVKVIKQILADSNGWEDSISYSLR